MGLAPVPVYAQERKEKTLAKVLAFCFGMAKVKPQQTQGHLTPAKSRATHESTLRQMACTLTIWFICLQLYHVKILVYWQCCGSISSLV